MQNTQIYLLLVSLCQNLMVTAALLLEDGNGVRWDPISVS